MAGLPLGVGFPSHRPEDIAAQREQRRIWDEFNFPTVHVRLAANSGALASPFAAAVTFNTREYDTSGTRMWSAGAGSRLVAPRDGLYRVTSNVRLAQASGTGPYLDTYFSFTKATGGVLAMNLGVAENTTGIGTGHCNSMEWPMRKGDYVEVIADVATGGGVNFTFTGGVAGCRAELTYVRPYPF